MSTIKDEQERGIDLADAIMNYSVEVIKSKLQQGANASHLDGRDTSITPMQLAITARKGVSVVQHLVHYGARDIQQDPASLFASLAARSDLEDLLVLQYFLCDLEIPFNKLPIAEVTPGTALMAMALFLRRYCDHRKSEREAYIRHRTFSVFNGTKSSYAMIKKTSDYQLDFKDYFIYFESYWEKYGLEHRILNQFLTKFMLCYDVPELLKQYAIGGAQSLNACMAYGAESSLAYLAREFTFSQEDFVMSNIKFNFNAVWMLQHYLAMQPNQEKQIIIRDCILDEPTWRDFFDALRGISNQLLDQIVHFEMSGCGMAASHLRSLVPTLKRMRSLMRLVLNSNNISYPAFRLLIREVVPSGSMLSEVYVRHNYLKFYDEPEYMDKLREELESQFAPSLSLIDITGNYFDVRSAERVHCAVLSLFLEKSQLNPLQFAECVLKQAPLKRQRCFWYDFYGAAGCVTVSLDFEQQSLVDQLMRLWEMPSFDKLIQYLQLGLQQAVLHESTATLSVRQLQRYHPFAPLKDYIYRHSIFRSESIERCHSLLFSKRVLDVHTGFVYLIAHKRSNGFFNEHAMLAWEFLSKSGQRVFTVAHLQYSNKPFVDYYTGRNIGELPGWIDENCFVVSFLASKAQIKNLVRDVQQQVDNGINADYSSYYFASLGDPSPDKKLTNCMRWAVDLVNASLGLNMEAAAGHVPSWTLQRLKDHPKRVDYNAPGDGKVLGGRILQIPMSDFNQFKKKK